jgi:hypothetical protein
MDTSLRQRLEVKNNDLFLRLRYIETEARKLWEYSQAGENAEFTPHGLSHISRVERNAEIFLGDVGLQDLNATEIFILLVSTFFHDAFMIPRSSGDGARARQTHAIDAKANLNQINSQLNLIPQEIFAISEVIRGHAVNRIPVPAPIREYLGKNIKLVQTGDDGRLAWQTDEGLWVNISNRSMHTLYTSLRSGNLNDQDRFLVQILSDILSLKMDDAVTKLVSAIATGQRRIR